MNQIRYICMKYKEKLDRVFSEYIRRRDADENGIAKCVTCGTEKHWKEMQAGHFIPRGNMSTRWHEGNVHVQCKECNEFKGGNLDEYELFIVHKYDRKEPERLRKIGRTEQKIMEFEIKELIKYYRMKIKNEIWS